jgi:hypothetical protein
MEQARDNREELTVDYQANATRDLTPELAATFSAGTQLITRRRDVLDGTGIGFVTNFARSIGSAVGGRLGPARGLHQRRRAPAAIELHVGL